MQPGQRPSRRLLFVSNLFPDASAPVRGLDNATLLHALESHWSGGIRVLSPRPVLAPFSGKVANLSPRPQDAALQPRYIAAPYLPKVGSRCNDWLMERALRGPLADSVAEFSPDLILGSWLYPDGCALAGLVRAKGLPLVLITQGTDTHQYLQHPVRRRKILNAIDRSDAVICRSGDLARRLSEAGACPDKLKVIYNGVDTGLFHPGDHHDARKELQLDDSPLLLFVGNLLPVKNPDFLLRAHAALNHRRSERRKKPAILVLIGEGPLGGHLSNLAAELGSSSQVRFEGRCTPQQVARWMQAANALCLCSHNEGFPNVILEAHASDLPVIATDVGGIAERMAGDAGDHLIAPDDLKGFADAMETRCQDHDSDRQVLQCAKRPQAPDWPMAAQQYQAVFDDVMARRLKI